jgi:AraC-like DNA-binding protein
LLVETDDGIIDVAYSVGFGNLSVFYRFFKDAVGTTPAAFRKENQKI